MSTHKILLDAIKHKHEIALPLLSFSRQVTNSSLVPYFVADEAIVHSIMIVTRDNGCSVTSRLFRFLNFFHKFSKTFQFTPKLILSEEAVSDDGESLKDFVQDCLVPSVRDNSGSSYLSSSLKSVFLLDCSYSSSATFNEILSTVLPAVRSLEEIVLDPLYYPSQANFQHLKALKSIRTLVLKDCSRPSMVRVLAEGSSALKHSLEDIRLYKVAGDFSFIDSSFRNLKRLCIEGDFFVTTVTNLPDLSGDSNTTTAPPHLESLVLENIKFEPSAVLGSTTLTAETGDRLRSLKLWNCQGINKFDFLRNCLSLLELEIAVTDFLERTNGSPEVRECVECISELENLRKLVLSGFPFTDGDIKTILFSPTSSSTSTASKNKVLGQSLQHFRAGTLPMISVECIPHLARCSQLKTLQLCEVNLGGRAPSVLAAASLSSSSSSSINTPYYNLEGNNNNNDDRVRFMKSFSEIGKLADTLEEFSFFNCVLAEQLEIIGSKMKKLQKLTIISSRREKKEKHARLSSNPELGLSLSPPCPPSQTNSLSDDDRAIRKLLLVANDNDDNNDDDKPSKICETLTELELMNFTSATDASLSCIASSFEGKRLSTLRLHNMPELSYKNGVAKFIVPMTTLRELMFYDCDSVRQYEKELEKRMPFLKELSVY